MRNILNPFRFMVIAAAGWMNQNQQYAIEYLREENRVLREQLGTRRLRFTDDQRRRLAAKAKLVGRRLLSDIPAWLRLTHSSPGTANSLLRSMTAVPSEDRDCHASAMKSKYLSFAWLGKIAIG